MENFSPHWNHQQHLMKVTSVPVFIPTFSLLSCWLDNFKFKVLYLVILYYYYVQVLCGKRKTICFFSSIIKYIVVFTAQPRLVVKLIWCFAFASTSSTCCLLKSIAIFYDNFLFRYNLANNQSCNDLFDQLQSFECFPLLLNHFLLVDQKSLLHQSWHCSL